jgi:hypothetical protein
MRCVGRLLLERTSIAKRLTPSTLRALAKQHRGTSSNRAGRNRRMDVMCPVIHRFECDRQDQHCSRGQNKPSTCSDAIAMPLPRRRATHPTTVALEKTRLRAATPRRAITTAQNTNPVRSAPCHSGVIWNIDDGVGNDGRNEGSRPGEYDAIADAHYQEAHDRSHAVRVRYQILVVREREQARHHRCHAAAPVLVT